MPLYEYMCQGCSKTFTELRSMSEREDPIACPECGGEGEIVFSTFAQGSSSGSGGPMECPGTGAPCTTPT